MSLIPGLITLGTEVVARSQQGFTRVRSCETIARLLRGLVGILLRMQEMDLSSGAEDITQDLKDLEANLQITRKLVDSSCLVPSMYRTINAFKLSADFRSVCQSLAAVLEDLNVRLNPSGSLGPGVKGDLQKLEIAFKKATFPLEKRELNIYNTSQKISNRVYNGKLPAGNGVEQMQDLLETTLGLQQIKDEWKDVAEQLLHDIDAARVKKDREQEFYTRMLFWAVTGCDMPPPEFYCPISLEIMEDPVVLIETAVTYDRKSLDTWLHVYGSSRCPVSGQNLDRLGYVENKALRCLIDDWKRHHLSQQELMLDQSLGSTSEQVTTPTVDDVALEGVHSADITTHDTNLPGVECLKDWIASREVESEVEPLRPPVQPNPLHHVHNRVTSTGSYGGSSDKRNLKRRPMRKDVIKDIHMACSTGDIEALKEYEDEGFTFDGLDENGQSCLHSAASGGHVGVMEFLLARGADVNARSEGEMKSPLYEAACVGSLKAVAFLLNNRADIMVTTKRGWSPLHAAADLGHAEVVKEILKHAERERMPSYPTITTEAGWTVLHHAARRGNELSVKYLLPFFKNVNQGCTKGYTALHVAVDNKHDSIARMLLQKGASPDEKSNDGWTPLHVAQDLDNVPIGRMLLEFGADPNIGGKDGLTPLHRAAFQDHLKFAMLLLDEGKADIKKRTMPNGEPGRKAIEIASDANHHEMYYLLFKRGVRAVTSSVFDKIRPRKN